MALSENQIKELEKRIGNTPIDPEFELEWSRAELLGAQNAEKKARLAFRFHKAVGNHEAMESNVKAVEEIIESIKYLTARITKLEKVVAKVKDSKPLESED